VSARSAPPPVFYGAVNLYLRHRFPALRRLPDWTRRLLDCGPLLRLAGSMSGTTTAAGLEELTLSMLRGEQGGQAEELEALLGWLARARPEVVHLSNCLLLGTVRRIRRELGIPVACSLQDEDTWLDGLGPEARERAWGILRERAAEVDLFLPVSAWYARFMAERLGIGTERLQVLPMGIELDGFPHGEPEPRPGPPVIGFLSHVCERMGAGVLAEAFQLLAASRPGLQLWFLGGRTGQDSAFLARMRRRLARAGLSAQVRFAGSFGRAQRIRFLSSISLLSVPVLGGQAFGTFILEALAAGVPVVQPRLGGFTEVVGDTGGGLLYGPNTPEALAAAIGTLLDDPGRARALGRAGRAAVLSRYTSAHMAAGLESAFAGLRRKAG